MIHEILRPHLPHTGSGTRFTGQFGRTGEKPKEEDKTMKYQAYIKGKPQGKPKTESQKEAIDRCISGVLWEVLRDE